MSFLPYRASCFQTGPYLYPYERLVALMTGLSLFYLATTLQRIYRAYPEAVQEPKGSVDLPIGRAMILLTGSSWSSSESCSCL
jgi:hypothetical protein